MRIQIVTWGVLKAEGTKSEIDTGVEVLPREKERKGNTNTETHKPRPVTGRT